MGAVTVGFLIDFTLPFVIDCDVVPFDVRGTDGVLQVTVGRIEFTFEGVPFPCEYSSGGSVRVGGRKEEERRIGNIKEQNRRNCVNDHLTLRQRYKDGECKLSVNEFDLMLLNHGAVLVCQGERFDIGRGLHRVTIGKDGRARFRH